MTKVRRTIGGKTLRAFVAQGKTLHSLLHNVIGVKGEPLCLK